MKTPSYSVFLGSRTRLRNNAVDYNPMDTPESYAVAPDLSVVWHRAYRALANYHTGAFTDSLEKYKAHNRQLQVSPSPHPLVPPPEMIEHYLRENFPGKLIPDKE